MRESRVNRREFFESTAAVAGLAVFGLPRDAPAALQTQRVRRNFGQLDPSKPQDRQVIEDYAEGVRILRERSRVNRNDPRGWAVQAGLHTYRCQHGNWWFLPWHRAYLYYFERMIQEAIAKPGFALPYWDWTDRAQLTLPAAFRDPGSPLYDRYRRAGVNDGTARLNWSSYPNGVLDYVLNIRAYVPSLSSPAADAFPGLERTHGPDLGHGDLEGGPHDYVHVWVAGPRQRDMGDPRFAALDPIFWLHHCNIDRLWTRWLLDGANRRHPVNSVWRNQQFAFLGPNGNSESIRVDQLLDTRSAPLNYRYDDEPPGPAPPALLAAIQVPDGAAREEPPVSTPEHRRKLQGSVIAVASLRYEIGREPLTVQLPLPSSALSTLDRVQAARAAAEDPAAQPDVFLAIEDVEFEAGASGFLAVYLDTPGAGEGDTPRPGRFLGTIALFGDHAHGAQPAGEKGPPAAPPEKEGDEMLHGARAEQPRVTRIFDVTEPVLKARSALRGADDAEASLRVSLVRQPLDADAEQAALEGKVTFSRAALRTTLQQP